MGRWGSKILNFWWSFGFTCFYRILGNFEHIFPPESPKCARWVGGVCYLGQILKKSFFFLEASLMGIFSWLEFLTPSQSLTVIRVRIAAFKDLVDMNGNLIGMLWLRQYYPLQWGAFWSLTAPSPWLRQPRCWKRPWWWRRGQERIQRLSSLLALSSHLASQPLTPWTIWQLLSGGLSPTRQSSYFTIKSHNAIYIFDAQISLGFNPTR